jgi:methylenetetrahydrofolate--tRNA-(uracil-5-)-methyltransferase
VESKEPVIIIGGGLAGSEAAWQIAQAGFHVRLFEMRPSVQTPAHSTGLLGELICSNSFGSGERNRASGLLKEEIKTLGSLLVKCAEDSALPAGGALAVDRQKFASSVTSYLENHPNIEVIREEATEIPDSLTIVASGPLTSDKLCQSISALTGSEQLYFYDALAPLVATESINMDIAFKMSRYDWDSETGGDYINCPFDKEQYSSFITELLSAQSIALKPFESAIPKGARAGKSKFFEACLPIEVMAARDPLALSFGPMKPVGLRNPHNGQRPFAVLQLRQDDLSNTICNLVGFQTNLTFSDQKRIFSMIPGLENAEFIRYGQMHRNTFVNSPILLEPTLQYKNRLDLFFAGQIAGIEGYIGNIASGLLSGINAVRLLKDLPLLNFPPETMLGAMHRYISGSDSDRFQPMKANFGLLPPLEVVPENKQERGFSHAKRSKRALADFMVENKVIPTRVS